MHGTHGEIGVLETLELVRMSHLCSSENASRIVPGECSGRGVTRRTVAGRDAVRLYACICACMRGEEVFPRWRCERYEEKCVWAIGYASEGP